MFLSIAAKTEVAAAAAEGRPKEIIHLEHSGVLEAYPGACLLMLTSGVHLNQQAAFVHVSGVEKMLSKSDDYQIWMHGLEWGCRPGVGS